MKKTKIFLLALVVASAMTSCEISYDPKTRYVFKSHAEDENGNPLAGVEVYLVAEDDNDIEMISQTKTDANGNALMVVPKVRNDGRYNLEYGSFDEIYRSVTFRNIGEEQFDDYTFSSSVKLDKISETVLLYLNYQGPDSRILESVEFVGNIGSQSIIFGDYDYLPEIPNGTPHTVNVYKNQTIQIVYTVRDSSTQTTSTETINLDILDQNVNYTLNY